MSLQEGLGTLYLVWMPVKVMKKVTGGFRFTYLII